MKKILMIAAISGLAAKSFAQDNPCKPNAQIAAAEREAAKKRFDGNLKALASNDFTVSYYRCRWNINPTQFYISGNVTSVFNITQTTSSITYDLSNTLTVDSVKMRKDKLTFSRGTDNTLKINLPSSYAAGKQDSLTIFYKGTPGNSGFGSFIQSSHSGTPVIWTLSEPYGAKDWWPCRNGLDDKADSIDIYVTYPSQYKLASNGLLMNTTLSGGNATTWYKHRYPIATYLVAISVTNFATFSENVQLRKTLLPVIDYIYPEDSAYFRSNNYFVLQAMKLYDSVWADYPFSKERYGETEFGWGGGMEHQTNSFVTSPDEGLVVHELAHQWFGDKITCGSWQDIWLNEGFATYNAEYLYNERYHPELVLANAKSERQYITILPNGSVWVDDTTSVNRIFDGRLSYSKGAFVIRMLRSTIGDQAFFKGMRNYQSDPKIAYGFARTADLQRNLEQASGQNLTYFFNQWFYGQGYPSITTKWSQTGTGPVTITVSETTSHSSVSFFKMRLPVQLKKGSQSKMFYLKVASNGQSFTVNPGFAADTLIIDPNVEFLSKNNKSIRTTAPASSSFTVSPNPFTNTLQVNLNNSVAGKTGIVKLMDNLGNVLASQYFTTTGSAQKVQMQVSNNVLPGIYQLHLVVDGKNEMQTVIKQ